MSARRFDGKTALVAVGHERIAVGIARRLAAEGAGVVVLGADEERLRAVEDELSAAHGVAVYGLAVRFAKPREVESALGETMRVFGGLDVVVAGLYGTASGVKGAAPGDADVAESTPAVTAQGDRRSTTLSELEDDDFSRAVDAGLRPVYAVCRRAARLLVGRGRAGSFVVIVEGGAGGPARAALAAALDHLVKAMAVELAPNGIRVNGVAAPLEAPAPPLPPPLLSRPTTPDDVAAAVAFLASDAASYLVGTVLPLDAGLGAAR